MHELTIGFSQTTERSGSVPGKEYDGTSRFILTGIADRASVPMARVRDLTALG